MGMSGSYRVLESWPMDSVTMVMLWCNQLSVWELRTWPRLYQADPCWEESILSQLSVRFWSLTSSQCSNASSALVQRLVAALFNLLVKLNQVLPKFWVEMQAFCRPCKLIMCFFVCLLKGLTSSRDSRQWRPLHKFDWQVRHVNLNTRDGMRPTWREISRLCGWILWI